MTINWRVWMRKSHRWGAIVVAVPFLLILLTGLLLQLKKEWPWVQPPGQRGQGKVPTIRFEALLATLRTVPEAEVRDWSDVERLDVQPKRGLVKVQARNSWEVQIDVQTAQVLQVAYRRSDLIEALHDGSWFHDQVKLWVFLPVAIVVLLLWGTGIYLFWLPYAVRWSRQRQPKATVPPSL